MDLPVLPTLAMSCPAFTVAPLLTRRLLQCPYRVESPPGWEMTIVFPYPPIQPECTTFPSPAATMPVPLGALMSSPEWKTLLRPNGLLRHPNTLDILPMTGHLNILEEE